jgi:hypothetical protein
MAGANSNIQLTDLDFNNIKSNFKTFLQSQNVLQDYNYEGSALSVLLDVLAYNTQYNAYYLNMVANEMFLDTALLRSSVVSQAKLLDYVPKSSIAPSATIQLVMSNVTTPSLTLPKFTRFMSEAIDGVNYTFVTDDSQTVNVIDNTATFDNVTIKQGLPVNLSFTVNSTNNPKYIFEIVDKNVDTTTLQVSVQQSSSNSALQIYNPAKNYLELNSTSMVYFVQESLTGTYEIYFGDGILGNKLSDGNVVNISYVSTQGTMAAGANNFVLMDTISGFSVATINPLISATSGGDKESIDSIKFQAPKSYAAQGRAVTKNDYITAIQQNSLGISFDAVNVWGGEENNPPVYGQAFICLKPTGSYTLTEVQKQRLISEVLKPISVLTVTPTIVDPDYTYIQLTVNVVYDPTQTTKTAAQIQAGVTNAIQNFGKTTLNTFNSSFNSYDLLTAIQNYDLSISSSDYTIKLQKKFLPNISTPQTYNFYYNTPLKQGVLLSGIGSTPDLFFSDPSNIVNTISGVYLEEVPSSTYGVDNISVINPGFNYQLVPTVTILGDGTGGTAEAVVVNGSITKINVTNAGNNYTSAVVSITPQPGDTTGQSGAAIVNLQGRFGTLRTYYFNAKQIKTILNSNIGTIDYMKGVVTLNNFNPIGVDNPLGQLSINVTPTTSTFASTQNGIITIDPFDATAITVNVTAKSNL